jgi:hypothetical protein
VAGELAVLTGAFSGRLRNARDFYNTYWDKFAELVRMIAAAAGSNARIVRVPAALAFGLESDTPGRGDETRVDAGR